MAVETKCWQTLVRRFRKVFVYSARLTFETVSFAFVFIVFLLAYGLFLPFAPLFVLRDTLERHRFVNSLHPLVRQLGDSDPEERRQAFEQLMAMDDKAIPLLIPMLIPPVKLMTSKKWNFLSAQALAIIGLAQMKAKDAIENLVEVLEDHDFNPPEIRAIAAWALGEIGDEEAIPNLIEALMDESIADLNDLLRLHFNSVDISSSKPVKHYVAEALRKFGLGELVDALFRVLEEMDEKAVKVLKQFEPYRDQINEVLISALNSRSPNLSSQAAWALGELGEIKAIPMLERKVWSPFTPKIVKEACREALKKFEVSD